MWESGPVVHPPIRTDRGWLVSTPDSKLVDSPKPSRGQEIAEEMVHAHSSGLVFTEAREGEMGSFFVVNRDGYKKKDTDGTALAWFRNRISLAIDAAIAEERNKIKYNYDGSVTISGPKDRVQTYHSKQELFDAADNERERCAKIAEHQYAAMAPAGEMQRMIASRIRAGE